MHLTNCLHPVQVKIRGEVKVVPCGKCEACRYVRSLALEKRFELEMAAHRFGLFFTLTYADPFLPFMSYDPENRIFYRSDASEAFSFDDFDSGQCWPFPYMSEDSQRLVDLQVSKFGAVPCLRKADLQKFFKRVRITLNRKLHEKIEIFYGACGEMGPTTFRPHYHGLLLFDNENAAKILPEILRKTWYFGSVVCRFTKSGENASYITRYLNSFDGLPSIYRPREVRPFFVFSKSHPLGFRTIDKAEIQRVFMEAAPTVSVTNAQTREKYSIPLPSVFENKLFPKFTGFGSISHRLRVGLLELSLLYDSYKDFRSDCISAVETAYVSLCSRFKKDCDITIKFADSHGTVNHINTVYYTFDSQISQWLYLCNKDVALPFGWFKKSSFNALRSLYYAGRRYLKLLHSFDFSSIDELVRNTERFEFNRSMYLLKLQADFENEIMKTEPDMIKFIDLECFTDEIFDSIDFKNFHAQYTKVLSHSKMNKRKNEFLRLHPEYSLSGETMFNHL